MINIINKFFQLYENDQIEINWDKSNMSFNFQDGSKSMSLIIDDLNDSSSESDEEFEESDVVNTFFAIMTNMISEYFNDEILNGDVEQEINNFIKEQVPQETISNINMNIFLDNNISGERLSNVDYEILSKRSKEDILKINGYTTKIRIQTNNRLQENKSLELELKLSELDEIIETLNEAKDALKKLNV